MDARTADPATSKHDTEVQESDGVYEHIKKFLIARSEVYRELAKQREEGWHNPRGDEHFKKQRQAADEASMKACKVFYKMMQSIADELQAATGALAFQNPSVDVFDICMAPGGYSASALKYSPQAHISGLTLPLALGGHPLLVHYGRKDPRIEVKFADITMLAAEYGVSEIPEDHPDASKFSTDRPWVTKSFDLVFCDGQVLWNHKRASYREPREASRLTCSSLILGMQRIKRGGTLIILLHKVEMWQTIKLLSVFDKISKIELFKPIRSHKTRSSFYLIARHVQPHQQEAVNAVNEWKAVWKAATFPQSEKGDERLHLDSFRGDSGRDAEISSLLASFGDRLIELGEPVWRIQSDALSKAPWCKSDDFKSDKNSEVQVRIPASDALADLGETMQTFRSLEITEE